MRRLLGWTAERFESAGIDSPRVDAEHLLSFALECSRMSLYMEHDKVVDASERARFREVVKRRLAREPVAYIEGKRGFHALGLELAVDRRVLIPRPETEHLVDWILEDLSGPRVDAEEVEASEEEPLVAESFRAPRPDEEQWVELDPLNVPEPEVESEADAEPEGEPQADAEPEPADLRAVLDVGTGSGAIALALKHARPSLRVTACDVSDDALGVARHNAQRLELDVPMVRSDLLADVSTPADGWAVIVANLPYIREPEWRALAPEVVRFEPRLALEAGSDGLDAIRRLIAQAPSALAPGGGLYLEIGYDQGESVPELMRAGGLVDVQMRKDYSGHPRMVRGRRPAT